MNTEFTSQLEAYKHYLDMRGVPGIEETNVLQAGEYLKKYGLSDASYKKDWKLLHNTIFDLCSQLPNMIFKKNFEFISLLGGVMFEQEDFEQFKLCIQKIGEKSFIIIQDTFGMKQQQIGHSLKMKYPMDIEWSELNNGNFISAALFEASENDYYIFGDSGLWGIYVATEYIDEAKNPAGTPIRILGFDSRYRTTFRQAFEIPQGEYCENVDYIPEEERPDLKEWVPKAYRN